MEFGFEVVAATRRTAATWFEEQPDEVWHIEFEDVGEAVVRQNFDRDDNPSGFEYDAFRYDDLPARHEGEASSLAEAKRIAEEYVKGGQQSLAATAAKPKRQTGEEPVQVPMRPQQAIRQSLSADQKKVRRQMTRKTAAETPKCPNCSSSADVFLSDPPNIWECEECERFFDAETGLEVTSSHTTTKESSMSARREAELLQAMAVASLDDQRRIAAELADLRRERTASRQAEREVHLSDTVVRAHLTPVAPFVPHTASTDWMGEDVEVYSGDPSLEVKSAATIWFNKTSAALREDDEEFAMQAEGMALRTAGRYGEQFEQAHRAFMDHVAHLYSKVALEADPSGQGQSTITDYDTKTDQDPLFAEDWDGEDETGSSIGSGVHPTPLNLAENTGTGGGTAGDDVNDDSTSMATPDSGPHTRSSSRRQAKEGDPHGEDQERIDWLETRGDDLSGPDADTIREMDDEEFDRWMDRESKRRAARRRTAAEGQTCSVCGDKIAHDPNGEDPSTWHHDNGEKHDHEAKPGSKESRRVTALQKGDGCVTDDGKKGRVVGVTEDGYEVKWDDGGTATVSRDEVKANTEAWFTGSKKTAGDQVTVLTIPNCDVHKFQQGVEVPAKYDCKLVGLGGSWGNVCEECFQAYGPGTLGTGSGQMLIQGSTKVAEDQRRSADENDSPVAESRLPQVEVGNPNDEAMFDDGDSPKPSDDPAIPSGAADVLGHDPRNSSLHADLDVVAAFRARVQASLARNPR